MLFMPPPLLSFALQPRQRGGFSSSFLTAHPPQTHKPIMKTNKQTRPVIKLMISLLSASMLMRGTPAQAFWPSDADTSFNAYNNAFYVGNGGNAFYKQDTGSGTGPGWWTLAEEIEM